MCEGRGGNLWLSGDGCAMLSEGRDGNSWLSADGCDMLCEGRGGNSWLSPDGCAMFSVHVRVHTSSRLGQRVSFIQHLMSLAVVLAVRQKAGCEVCSVGHLSFSATHTDTQTHTINASCAAHPCCSH